MKTPPWPKVSAWLFPPDQPDEPGRDRSAYVRFAIPHTFKPQLSLAEALLAAFTALLRIFLGSLLFAVWGVYMLVVWNQIRNPFLRVFAMLPLGVIFVVLFAVLMRAISAFAGIFIAKRA